MLGTAGLISSLALENEGAQAVERDEPSAPSGAPYDLRCEYRVNPLGLDERSPRLSWKLNDPRRGARQTAYRVLVAGDASYLNRHQGEIWDSGKVSSERSALIEYRGSELKTGRRYYWKVRIWDQNGQASPWSEPAWWEMGFLQPSDWKAHWIGAVGEQPKQPPWTWGEWIGNPVEAEANRTAYFRKTFTLPAGVTVHDAEIRITADDRFTLSINGNEIGSGSDWNMIYSYRVGSLLRPGKNVIAAAAVNDGGPYGLLFSLQGHLSNGKVISELSDADVRTSAVKSPGWELPSFDDSGWDKPEIIAPYGGGSWGKAGEIHHPARSIMLRKEFQISKRVAGARAYVTGLGSYELVMNGRKVSPDLLSPGWTNYPTDRWTTHQQRISYQVYDVTTLIRHGQNAVAAILGNMWWSSGLGPDQGWYYSEGPLRFLLQLVLRYTDGSESTVITDSSWTAHDSPIVYDSMYNGETYDARLEQPGWDLPHFSGDGWVPVHLLDSPPIGRLVAQREEPIRCTQELKPVSINRLSGGSYGVNFGQNFAGRVRLRVSGPAGAKVVLRHAEVLNPDGTLYTANLRSARATDTYILKGDGVEEWEPRFTYHGFQYVEMIGFPGTPDLETLTGRFIHTAAPSTGGFECSNELINRINHNCLWSLRSNMYSVATDCPQRDERLGWMGDAQVESDACCWNMEMASFYFKRMDDITDGRLPNGAVENISPPIVVIGPASPAWGDEAVLIPWFTYLHYGDGRIIKRYFDTMVGWIEYMRANSQGGLLFEAGGFGDWVSVVPSPAEPIAAAYFYYDCMLVSKMAKVIGREAEATKYADLAIKIAAAFNAKYFDPKTNNYLSATQTADVVPLAFGLVPADRRAAVAANIVRDIAARGNHLSTGLVGTAYLLPALEATGHHDVAYALTTQTTYPSWGYMVKKGATTMWELWNSDTQGPAMNSRNHILFEEIAAWFYEHLAGIQYEFERPGFKHFTIHPQPAGDLKWVRASHRTQYGLIAVHWKLEERRFTLAALVPPNTSATINVPILGNRNAAIWESGRLLVHNGQAVGHDEGITFKGMSDSFAAFEVGAGHYQFVVE